MSERNRSWQLSGFGVSWLRRATTSWPVVTAASGLLAGMGSFMFANPAYAPVPPELSGLVVALAGAMPPVYAASLSESVRSAVIGYLLGAGVFVLASIGPWFVLSFSPQAVDVLAYTELGLILGNAFFTVFLVYFTGYLTTVFCIGVLGSSA